MKRQFTVTGTYGRGSEATIYCLETRRGYWYAAQGSTNVNFTLDSIGEGVDIEALADCDHFTASAPIESTCDLLREVES